MWVQVTTLEYQGLNEGHKEYAEQWAHSTAYVTPQAVVAVLGTKEINGELARRVVLQGGQTIWVLDGPDNLTALLDLLDRGSRAWEPTIVMDKQETLRD